MDIFCFGDSITRGEYDAERGGWVDRLKTECLAKFLAEGDPEICVFNLGIGGETTRMMRSRFVREIQVRRDRFSTNDPGLVTLAYGANDCAESGGNLLVTPEEYIDNLSWAIDESRKLDCQVLLLNVTPIAASADGVRSGTGKLRTNSVINQYNDLLLDLSQKKSVELVDVNCEFKKGDLKTLFVADGIHPNAAGHDLIYKLVRVTKTASITK